MTSGLTLITTLFSKCSGTGVLVIIFKREAIEWAWELVVERWKFPAQRIYATVYKPGPGEPAEFDQEAYDHWERLFRDGRP
jgi:Alanyl-tRNA synthetase